MGLTTPQKWRFAEIKRKWAENENTNSHTAEVY